MQLSAALKAAEEATKERLPKDAQNSESSLVWLQSLF
jgi:hypothetical protein